MMTRASNINVGGTSRQAFKDVSNANNRVIIGAAGNKAVVVKPTHGTKTRLAGLVVAGSKPLVKNATTAATTRSSALGAASKRIMNEDVIPPPFRSMSAVVADPNSYQVTGAIDNIDERDQDDPLCVTDYVHGLYSHFRVKEIDTSVRPVYMENQPHINERMRSILVDWLVEVHLKFKLVPETLYLTINLIDRYLEQSAVSRHHLQLLGVTCLLLASKYEEIYAPELRDLVYICDRAYAKQDIIEMEVEILKTLTYQVTIPSAHVFLVRMLKAGHADKKIVQLSCFILDGTLQSYNLLDYLPSQLAAGAIYIARRSLGRNGWSPTLLKYSNYCEEEVIPVARAILAAKNAANPQLNSVNKKYTSQRYGSVAGTLLHCDG